jgi:hypothetical protein
MLLYFIVCEIKNRDLRCSCELCLCFCPLFSQIKKLETNIHAELNFIIMNEIVTSWKALIVSIDYTYLRNTFFH